LEDTPVKNPLHIAKIASLPLWARLTHRTTLRHLMAVSLGSILISIGMGIVHQFGTASATAEAFGWLIHAWGMTPILIHVDPLWKIILGTNTLE
jgi:hypothetical protein